ncbi:unnamed protein product [Prunus brigantina]
MHLSIEISNFNFNSSTIQIQCMNQPLFQSTLMTITMVSSFMKKVVDVRLVFIFILTTTIRYVHSRVAVIGGLAPLSTSLPSYAASQPSLCVGLGSLVHDL